MHDMGPQCESELSDLSELEQFLDRAADDDVKRFLRRLPMIAGMSDGLTTMADVIFEIRLLPFVEEAWTKVEGSPGVPGRLLQIAEVYRVAEAKLFREFGIKRRQPRVIDVPSFLDIYATSGLP